MGTDRSIASAGAGKVGTRVDRRPDTVLHHTCPICPEAEEFKKVFAHLICSIQATSALVHHTRKMKFKEIVEQSIHASTARMSVLVVKYNRSFGDRA